MKLYSVSMLACFSKRICFEKIESTNDYLLELYRDFSFDETVTVFANQQIKGRGRVGRKWFTDSNYGLTFSFSLTIDAGWHVFELNQIITLSICEYINDMRVGCLIKYPNDIIYNGNKISGVLIETVHTNSERYCVIGVGLNLNNKSFPPHLPNAISLRMIKSKSFNKEQFFENLIEKIKNKMLLFLENRILIKKQYFSCLYGTQDYIPCLYLNKRLLVKVLSITKEGFLSVVNKQGSIFTVNASQIQFLLN